jgi:hypothetical protein
MQGPPKEVSDPLEKNHIKRPEGCTSGDDLGVPSDLANAGGLSGIDVDCAARSWESTQRYFCKCMVGERVERRLRGGDDIKH